MWRIRQSQKSDLPVLRALIASEGGDTEGLEPASLLAAEAEDGSVIGCVRLKRYPDGEAELASLVVAPRWRATGLGKALVGKLLEDAPKRVWLMCGDEAAPFFRRFGFQRVAEAELPQSLAPKWRHYVADGKKRGYRMNLMRQETKA